MRDIVLFVCILSCLAVTLRQPFAGGLLWVWFSVMNPQDEANRLSQSIPLNLIIAIVAFAAWMVSKERKTPPKDMVIFLLGVLLFWMTFNSLFAVDPSWSWPIWNRVWKTYAMCYFVSAMTVSKVRFHALMWVVALSLGYWGVKGGLFTLLSGGGSHVVGPASSEIHDNNNLACATVMLLPVLYYLYRNSGVKFIRFGLIAAIFFCVVSVLGSYSRGGYIALATLGFAFWLRAKNKVIYPIVAVIVLIPILKYMPDSFYARFDSIGNYDTDASFQGRVMAWRVAYNYATQHFPFGAGFYAPQLNEVWFQYFPDTKPHAAHSIYFQMLGEHGYPGLTIFLIIIALTFLNFTYIIRRTKARPDLAWANDLARMLQLSLFAFCVGGAALSLAYYDVFMLWIALSAALRAHVKTVRVAETTNNRPGYANEPKSRTEVPAFRRPAL